MYKNCKLSINIIPQFIYYLVVPVVNALNRVIVNDLNRAPLDSFARLLYCLVVRGEVLASQRYEGDIW